jgi:hypothetical protein
MNIGSLRLHDINLNSDAMVSPNGSLISESISKLIGYVPIGTTLDSTFWQSTIANAASSSQANGVVNLRTNTTADASISITSKKLARSVSEAPNMFTVILRLNDTGTANNLRRWGVFDSSNGFFFQLSGTTFSIVTRRASSDTAINSGSFNEIASFVVDINVHKYQIIYDSFNVYFLIDGKLYHQVTSGATQPSGSLSTGIAISNTNSGGSTSDIQMDFRSASVYRLGKEQEPILYYNITTNTTSIIKYGPGKLGKVIINQKGAAGELITIYDNTAASGNKIATIDPTASDSVLAYNVSFDIGLTVVTGSGTVGDYTIVYE